MARRQHVGAGLLLRCADQRAAQGGHFKEARHEGALSAGPVHLHGNRVQLRHAGTAAARAGLPEQGPGDHAHRRAHRGSQDRRLQACGVQVRRRHWRVCEAPEPRQERIARQADHDGSDARQRGDRHRAAVQRQLLRDGVQLCQQHQHGGRRHASVGFPHRADAHDQRYRPVAGPVQRHEGEPFRRRCARRIGGGGQRETVAAAV